VKPDFLPEVFPQKEIGFLSDFHNSLLWFSRKAVGYSLAFIRLKKAKWWAKIGRVRMSEWRDIHLITVERTSDEKDQYSSG
jgi:hypothetical protein